MGDTYTSLPVAEPTEQGFYKYSGGRQNMLFLLCPVDLGAGHVWKVIFSNGTIETCSWGYIEQALGVWDLEKIK